MQNLISLWTALDNRKRMVVLGATIGVFLAIMGLSRMANTPDMALLYAGLEVGAAGEVMAALDQRAVPYEVRGESIYVESAERDALRMALAAEGLPASGTAGYELLDGLSGFGTTSQMFDAAYWRAREGELARTILANRQIRSARVHIARAPAQPFRDDARATASVTVTTTTGSLPVAQAKALKHLVAGAVAGMRPEDVSIIDSSGGLIAVGDEAEVTDPAGDARAAMLRRNVERLLAARVGPGKAVVEVSLDVVTEREQISERRFDPQGRVAISTETEGKSDSATETAADVTVASNLPEGDAGEAGGATNQSSETRERVNFEVSETQRELLRIPGAIRKISVAVLVDGIEKTNEDGTVVRDARPDEELAALRELVASAVGLDEARGDVLTLKSLAFQSLPEGGTVAEAGVLHKVGALDVMSLIQMAVLALVSLILGLFVIRPVLSGGLRSPAQIRAEPAPLALPTPDTLDAAPSSDGFRVLTGEIDNTGAGFPAIGEPEAAQDPLSRLRRLIEERQAESVEILRGWLEEEETA